MARDRVKRFAGFTLVEMMVAMAVVVVGLGSVALAVQTSLMWIKETRNRQVALHEARSHFEFLRDSGYNLLSNGSFVEATNSVDEVPFITVYDVAMSTVSTNIKVLSLSTSWPSTFNPSETNTIDFTTFVSAPLHY